MTIGQALAAAAGMGLERLDAQLLLLRTLGCESAGRGWLLAHDGDELAEGMREHFSSLCARRASNEPLAYIVGRREFYGLDLMVDARVLVPRPDTETLVEWALELIAAIHAPRVIDLGTGSGAIALAIKSRRPDAHVSATDISGAALEVAGANTRALGLDVELRQTSWLSDHRGRYDLIVSNPPYVAAGDPHLAALVHEPLGALAAGPDGLDALRTISGQAHGCLAAGGWLVLEHGYDQAPSVSDLLAKTGFRQIESRRDLAGIERCTGGRRLEL